MVKTFRDELRKFIERFVDSFVSWDLIVFFQNNPGIVDTPTGLASRLGRKEEEVRKALDGLCQKGLLRKKEGGGKEVYIYSPPPHLKKVVDEFTKSLDDRSFRLRVLSYLLKKGAR